MGGGVVLEFAVLVCGHSHNEVFITQHLCLVVSHDKLQQPKRIHTLVLDL